MGGTSCSFKTSFQSPGFVPSRVQMLWHQQCLQSSCLTRGWINWCVILSRPAFKKGNVFIANECDIAWDQSSKYTWAVLSIFCADTTRLADYLSLTFNMLTYLVLCMPTCEALCSWTDDLLILALYILTVCPNSGLYSSTVWSWIESETKGSLHWLMHSEWTTVWRHWSKYLKTLE